MNHPDGYLIDKIVRIESEFGVCSYKKWKATPKYTSEKLMFTGTVPYITIDLNEGQKALTEDDLMKHGVKYLPTKGLPKTVVAISESMQPYVLSYDGAEIDLKTLLPEKLREYCFIPHFEVSSREERTIFKKFCENNPDNPDLDILAKIFYTRADGKSIFPKLPEQLRSYKTKVYDRAIQKRVGRLDLSVIELRKRLQLLKDNNFVTAVPAFQQPIQPLCETVTEDCAGLEVGDEALGIETPVEEKSTEPKPKRTRRCRYCRDRDCENAYSCPGSSKSDRCKCCKTCSVCIYNDCCFALSCRGRITSFSCNCSCTTSSGKSSRRPRRCRLCVERNCSVAESCGGRGGASYHNCTVCIAN